MLSELSRTTTTFPATSRARSDVSTDPGGRLAALAALPAGHPARPMVRDRAIEAWLPLARRLAGRYSGKGVPTEDLVQTAAVGLINAVDRFDPGFGTDFAGFAIPTIIGELKRYFRDRAWMVRVPRRFQELRLAMASANEELTHRLRRPPVVAEIAAHLDVTEEAVLEALEAARAYSALSLSVPLGWDDGSELGDTWARTTTRSPSRRPGSCSSRRWPASTSENAGS